MTNGNGQSLLYKAKNIDVLKNATNYNDFVTQLNKLGIKASNDAKEYAYKELRNNKTFNYNERGFE